MGLGLKFVSCPLWLGVGLSYLLSVSCQWSGDPPAYCFTLRYSNVVGPSWVSISKRKLDLLSEECKFMTIYRWLIFFFKYIKQAFSLWSHPIRKAIHYFQLMTTYINQSDWKELMMQRGARPRHRHLVGYRCMIFCRCLWWPTFCRLENNSFRK